MKRTELKKIIKEELKLMGHVLNEENSSKPVVNSKKAQGIILGAVKTLVNSGAITGVDPTNISDIANDLVKRLNVSVAPYGKSSEPTDDNLNDDVPYEKEQDSLDDQSQYDPDLSKQMSDYKPKPKSEPEDEPLFEIKRIARKLKI